MNFGRNIVDLRSGIHSIPTGSRLDPDFRRILRCAAECKMARHDFFGYTLYPYVSKRQGNNVLGTVTCLPRVCRAIRTLAAHTKLDTKLDPMVLISIGSTNVLGTFLEHSGMKKTKIKSNETQIPVITNSFYTYEI